MDQIERMLQVDQTLADLMEKGWVVERVSTRAEEGESFRVFIVVRIDLESALGGMI